LVNYKSQQGVNTCNFRAPKSCLNTGANTCLKARCNRPAYILVQTISPEYILVADYTPGYILAWARLYALGTFSCGHGKICNTRKPGIAYTSSKQNVPPSRFVHWNT